MKRLHSGGLGLCFSLVLVSGCSAITDFDRFGPGGDAGTRMDSEVLTDAQVLIDGCTPMGVEICNGVDDDCDGDIDENTQDDPENCGECDHVCPDVAHGVPGCAAGECTAECSTGFDDCDADPSTGCETDLSTIADCGTCGNACDDQMSATASCSTAGSCDFDCDPGFDDCDGDPANGCEADLNAVGTCGSCSTACADPTPLCSMGGCVSGCMAPSPTNCGGSCVDTSTDILHCGGCSMPCATVPRSRPTCAPMGGVGTCGFTCDSGWADCNATAGCETDIQTPANCGSCGALCTLANAIAGCGAGMCTVASCTGGYLDCDSIATNGCEERPGAYYRDGDGDGYGAGTAMSYCAALVPVGWVARNGDCLDTDRLINPGATELCNGIDDNCAGGIDEGFMLGTACVCVAGADPGIIMCDTGGGTSSCRYPAESCNGWDDNCDGDRDETFTCPARTTRSCTGAVPPGCTYVGTQTCNDVCAWDTVCAVPSESCNRMDDDCDLFTDEDALTMGTLVTTVPGVVAWEPRAAWHPARNEIGIVYGDGMPGAVGGNVYFVRATLTGTVIGAPLWIDNRSRSWDVAFDGTHYSVVYSSVGMANANPYLTRVDAATGARGVGLIVDWTGSGDGARRIAIARVGTADQVVVVWVEPGASSQSAEAQLVATPPSVSSASLVGTLVLLESSGGPRLMDWPVATATAAGAVIGYAHWRSGGGGTQNIQLHRVVAGNIETLVHPVATDVAFAERQLSITSNRAGVLGLAYETFDPSSGGISATVAIAVDATTFAELAAAGLVASTDVSIAYGGDDTFAVLHVESGGGRIHRYRSTDLVPLPEPALVPAWASFLTGVGGASATRYVVLRHGGALQAQPAVCR